MTTITRIQIRRGTAANWISSNPILALGEPALESDTGRQKIGDGTNTWTALPYVNNKLTPTAIKTSGYTAASNDLVLCDTSTGATPTGFTITLPTAPPDKTTVGVKMVAQASTNSITVATGQSIDKINLTTGGTTYVIKLLNQAATFQYQASTHVWILISDDLSLTQLDARYPTSGSYVQTSAVGAVNGVAPLDGTGLVPVANLPISAGAVTLVGNGTPSNGTGFNGDYYIDQATGNLWGPKASNVWPGSAGATIALTSLSQVVFSGTLVSNDYLRSNNYLWIGNGNTGLSLIARFENYSNSAAATGSAINMKFSGTDSSATEWSTMTFTKDQTWTAANSTRDASTVFYSLQNNNPVETLRLQGSNNYVGINMNAATPNFQLDVAGDIHSSTAVRTPGVGVGLGVGQTLPAPLTINGGDGAATYSLPTVALSYAGTNQYSHFIHTRHNGGGPSGNAIDFYTDDGSANPVFPTNSILGLSVSNGKAITPALQVTTGATPNGVLVSDASGNATWQSLSGTYVPLTDVANDFAGAYYMPRPSGDATGVTDTAAYNACVAALGGDTGVGNIALRAGTYHFANPNPVNSPDIGLIGPGNGLTDIFIVGNNSGITFTNPNFTGGSDSAPLYGFTVDGGLSGQGCWGMKVGNRIAAYINDIASQNFSTGQRVDTATVTAASGTVLDSSITTADQGKMVQGIGIPSVSYVGTVTNGVSFLLSASPTSQVNVVATDNSTYATVGGGIAWWFQGDTHGWMERAWVNILGQTSTSCFVFSKSLNNGSDGFLYGHWNLKGGALNDQNFLVMAARLRGIVHLYGNATCTATSNVGIVWFNNYGSFDGGELTIQVENNPSTNSVISHQTMWSASAANLKGKFLLNFVQTNSAVTWVASNWGTNLPNLNGEYWYHDNFSGPPHDAVLSGGNNFFGITLVNGLPRLAAQSYQKLTTVTPQTATVASGQTAVDVSTFTGTQSLTVSANSLAASGTIGIQMSNGSVAVIDYGGGGGTTTLTNCRNRYSGGLLSTGALIQQVSGTLVAGEAGQYEIGVVSGGGGGGGGGTGSANQCGGGGGGSGIESKGIFTLTAGQAITFIVGGGGAGGSGGATGSNPGIAGSQGGFSAAFGTGVQCEAFGGGGGNPSTATSTTPGAGGLPGNNFTTTITTPGAGGGSTGSTHNSGPPLSAQVCSGGGGGGTATSANGGNGGVAGAPSFSFAFGASTGSASGVSGGTGGSGGANSAAGGGGGGGSAGTSAAIGGSGGAGGSGYAWMRQIA